MCAIKMKTLSLIIFIALDDSWGIATGQVSAEPFVVEGTLDTIPVASAISPQGSGYLKAGDDLCILNPDFGSFAEWDSSLYPCRFWGWSGRCTDGRKVVVGQCKLP